MNASARRAVFLALSAELTGYSETDLEGTGNVDAYHALVDQQIGPIIGDMFYAAAEGVVQAKGAAARAEAMRIDVLASPTVWPLCQTIIMLWYLGSWSTPAASWYQGANSPVPNGVTPGNTFVPSAQAYTAQLAYRAAGAHPPGANPTGYGSWSLEPVFGDFVEGRPEGLQPHRHVAADLQVRHRR
jgi:hypothetical protein